VGIFTGRVLQDVHALTLLRICMLAFVVGYRDGGGFSPGDDPLTLSAIQPGRPVVDVLQAIVAGH
jgi:hypothetical protein